MSSMGPTLGMDPAYASGAREADDRARYHQTVESRFSISSTGSV